MNCIAQTCQGCTNGLSPGLGLSRELKVTESSESVLAGTKRPPFRLVVRAVMAHDGRSTVIRPAVSEEFVVCMQHATSYDLPAF